MTVTHDEAAAAAQARAGLIAGLHDLAAWLAAHPGSPVPVVHASFRVPKGPRGRQVDFLEDLAAWLGAELGKDEMGTLFARRDFGPVTAEGHLGPENTGTIEWLERAAALRAAREAGTGDAA